VTDQKRPHPVLLAIMDGWGERTETKGNGIKLANTPNIDSWRATRPWTLLSAAEKNVGLPPGQMGNSEVGHLNLGAGFVVVQDITLIDNSIVGQTRWTLHTINYALQLSLAHGTFGVQPFVEFTFGVVSDIGDGLFQAEALYGTNDVRGLTAGVRLDYGGAMGRMGRYGAVAVPDEQLTGEMHGHEH